MPSCTFCDCNSGVSSVVQVESGTNKKLHIVNCPDCGEYWMFEDAESALGGMPHWAVDRKFLGRYAARQHWETGKRVEIRSIADISHYVTDQREFELNKRKPK